MPDVPRRHLLGLFGGATLGLAGCNAPRAAFGGAPNELLRDARVERGLATYVVASTAELEAAFDSLAPGDTVYITEEGGPYRTTGWLDVDTDGVTVVGPNVPNLIKPAFGADAGGIRIGHGAHCKNVTIRGVGYHGNPSGQNPAAKWCHGITVRDAENVTLDGNYITRTHPYHEHGSGGSGISAERECRNVRILNNRIYDIGDRGIQVAGENVTVSGNIVTDGLDRSVSCDVWRDGEVYQARNLSIVNNVFGNNSEGSLTGIGGGNPSQTDRGNITIANNVGFGAHKSLCHLGFEGSIGSVQIRGNVSVQNAENQIAGISVEIDEAERVTIADNDLHGYSGRGINVEAGTSDFTVANNGVYDAGQVGIRIVGARHGTVDGNFVTGVGGDGVLIDGAKFVTVSDNRIRGAGRTGMTVGGEGSTHYEIGGNVVRGQGASVDASPGIVVRSSDNLVQRNRIYQAGAPAIVERSSAANNLYGSNWADGDDPWRIRDGGSAVRDHTPRFDVHRGVTADGSGRARVRFEKPYRTRPKLGYGRVGGGVRGVTYTETAAGEFDGVVVEVGDPSGIVDVFVSGR